MKFDLSLYLIADTGTATKISFLKAVEEAVAGGVTMVQFRFKNMSDAEALPMARSLLSITQSYGVPLIINDDVHLANSIGAEGVHLGQGDSEIEEARRILGFGRIIGLSAHTIEEAIEAQRKGADYIGVGTVYKTSSKSDIRGIIGVEGLRVIRQNAKIPMAGIGGIGITNASRVMETGVNGIAVIAAILAADQPGQAAKTLRQIVESHKMRGEL